MAESITIVIEQGKATVQTRGFQGKSCVDATAELQKAMGRTTNDTKTPEFEERAARQVGQ